MKSYISGGGRSHGRRSGCLHEKIDHLIFKQWQRLLEIQEIQTELMGELSDKLQARR